MTFVLAAVRWHQIQLHQRPYLTNWVTGVVLMGLGDRVAQSIESHDRPKLVGSSIDAIEWDERRLSWTRTGILSSWSAIISPWWTFWYRMLARRYPGEVIRWVAMTAGLSIPFNGAFFTYSTAVEYAVSSRFLRPGMALEPGAPTLAEAVIAKLNARLLPTVATSILVWVPVNAANFTLVPLHNRNLVASAFACGWNVFLSLQQHRHHTTGNMDASVPDSSHAVADLERTNSSSTCQTNPNGREVDSRAAPATESG